MSCLCVSEGGLGWGVGVGSEQGCGVEGISVDGGVGGVRGWGGMGVNKYKRIVSFLNIKLKKTKI